MPLSKTEGGISGNHLKRAKTRQPGNDVFCDAVAEKGLLGIIAHAGKRQDCNGSFSLSFRLLWLSDGVAHTAYAPSPDRLDDIFDGMRACVFPCDRNTVTNHAIDSVRDEYASRRGELFQTRSKVDA